MEFYIIKIKSLNPSDELLLLTNGWVPITEKFLDSTGICVFSDFQKAEAYLPTYTQVALQSGIPRDSIILGIEKIKPNFILKFVDILNFQYILVDATRKSSTQLIVHKHFTISEFKSKHNSLHMNDELNDELVVRELIEKNPDVLKVESLLKGGANPNFMYPVKIDKHEPIITLLSHAVISDQFEIVKLLLTYGAEINYQSQEGTFQGTTALMWAAAGGDIKKVKYLLEKGADVNLQDGEGLTAMMRAVLARKAKVLQILIDANSDLSIKSNDGMDVFDWAIGTQSKELIEILSKYDERKFKCFVATAVYEDINSKEVDKLRNFRDKYLINNYFGQLFTIYYYEYGPTLAKWITNKPRIKKILKSVFDLFLKE